MLEDAVRYTPKHGRFARAAKGDIKAIASPLRLSPVGLGMQAIHLSIRFMIGCVNGCLGERHGNLVSGCLWQ